ncbi:hypothetical protein V8G54_035655 [Vigna mungo]|uniref:Uncharacterized protein n=1 Tax=Vigna mungo TaxID=3915 RepID=A0AAQ3MFV1_VIGMU
MEEVGEHSKAFDTRKKLVFRHFCKTNFIGALNERLNTEQKTYINKIGCLLLVNNEDGSEDFVEQPDKSEDFVEQPFCGSQGNLQSTPVQYHHQTLMFEGGIENKQSTMYDRMKVVPRKRIKSVATKSPYTEHIRRKK